MAEHRPALWLYFWHLKYREVSTSLIYRLVGKRALFHNVPRSIALFVSSLVPKPSTSTTLPLFLLIPVATARFACSPGFCFSTSLRSWSFVSPAIDCLDSPKTAISRVRSLLSVPSPSTPFSSALLCYFALASLEVNTSTTFSPGSMQAPCTTPSPAIWLISSTRTVLGFASIALSFTANSASRSL
jgi:hypothetical protein